MAEYLNKALYQAMAKKFSAVEVVNRGDKGDYKRVVRQAANSQRQYVNYDVKPGGSFGERYRVDCPYCGDTRKRLYVTYLFGMEDEETGLANTGNIHCFNEACHEDYTNRRELLEDLELHGLRDYFVVQQTQKIEEADEASGEFTFRGEVGRPGECVQLSEIVEGTPDYRIIEYLRDERGFDVGKLQQWYGVEYLRRAFSYSLLSGRVWTPFYRAGAMIAWTARAVPGLCDSDIRHFHSPGGLGGLLYGLGSALDMPVLTLVEGPADRWAIGSSGVALLSKTLGGQKAARLATGLSGSKVELVLVLLDPEQPENEKAKGKPHQIEETVARVRKITTKPVLPVYLPSGLDPADAGGEFLARYLSIALRKFEYAEHSEVLARSVLASTATRSGYSGPSRIAGDDAG
jgi:hypothetical protein